MRIGFACKVLRPNGEPSKRFAFRSINRAQFRAAGGRKAQLAKVADVTFHNLKVLNALVARLEHLPSIQRMFRISNDLIPLIDLPEAQHVHGDKGFRRDLEAALAAVGARARTADVRLSTHPDQFIIPNSHKPNVTAKSIAYVEAWAELAQMMGYRGKSRDDFCINVHLGPRYDSVRELEESWRYVKRVMASGAFRLMTVENNDTTWTAVDLARVCVDVDVRAVLDVHHNWCVTGRHVEPSVPVVKSIIDTWDGRRPKLHFSVPKPVVFARDYLPDAMMHKFDLPSLQDARGATRPHADFLWSTGQLGYLTKFVPHFDVMLELKGKNLASERAINALEIDDDE